MKISQSAFGSVSTPWPKSGRKGLLDGGPGYIDGGAGVWYRMTMAFSEQVKSVEELKRNLRNGSYRNAFQSLRAMRRLLEKTLVEAYEGRRPTGHITHFAAGVKTAAELFMAEKQLVALGLDMEDVEHPLGRDGGLETNQELSPGLFVTQMKRIEQGVSPRGTPVSKYTRTEESGARVAGQMPQPVAAGSAPAKSPHGDIDAEASLLVDLGQDEEEW